MQILAKVLDGSKWFFQTLLTSLWTYTAYQFSDLNYCPSRRRSFFKFFQKPKNLKIRNARKYSFLEIF